MQDMVVPGTESMATQHVCGGCSAAIVKIGPGTALTGDNGPVILRCWVCRKYVEMPN